MGVRRPARRAPVHHLGTDGVNRGLGPMAQRWGLERPYWNQVGGAGVPVPGSPSSGCIDSAIGAKEATWARHYPRRRGGTHGNSKL
jgi:hypothetical protein